MTDRKQALTKLLENVEAEGNAPFMPMADEQVNSFDQRTIDLVQNAYSGSLDAAQALHEAVLPDKGWHVEWVAKYPALAFKPAAWCASVGWGSRHAAYADNPARAWLIAILKTLTAKEGDT